jgi:hypothetical protein
LANRHHYRWKRNRSIPGHALLALEKKSAELAEPAPKTRLKQCVPLTSKN